MGTTHFCSPDNQLCVKTVPITSHQRSRSIKPVSRYSNTPGDQSDITPHESIGCALTKNAGSTNDVIDDDDEERRHEVKGQRNPASEFGKSCGIDVDQIAYFLQRSSESEKRELWLKSTNDESVITKKTEIYKLLFALAEMTMIKENKNQKPPKDSIRKLMGLIWKKIPKESGHCSLQFHVFENTFHQILYQIHDEMNEKHTINEPENKCIFAS